MLLPAQLLLLIFFPGSAMNEFISRPPDQWKVLEGENITFLWTYTVDTINFLVLFSNVTGDTRIMIAGSTVNFTIVDPRFEKRFTAEISDTEAKITMLAVQMSDDKKKFEMRIAINTAPLLDYVELIVQCK